jgi:Holliday junction resolvase RusA-like endonuclease
MNAGFRLKTAIGSARPAKRKRAPLAAVGPSRVETSRVDLLLPVPPSANGLFANRAAGGRHRVKVYDEWRLEAGWSLQMQRPGRIAGPYILEITIPRGVGGDLDNRIKPISDLLVSLRVIDDDKHAERVTIMRGYGDLCGVAVMKARGLP